MNVTAKIYDRKTPFNNIPITVINAEFERMWGDAPVVLVYKDGEFTGNAEPLGVRTLEEVEQQFTVMFEEQAAASQVAEHQASTIDEVNAKLDFIIMMED